MITKWYTLPLYVAQHHVTDVDVQFELTHKRGKGWLPQHCIIPGNDGELVALSFGAADLGTFTRVITDTAMRHWEIHGEAILDDAGLLERETYTPSPPIYGVGARGNGGYRL
jgi:hypothetical protein